MTVPDWVIWSIFISLAGASAIVLDRRYRHAQRRRALQHMAGRESLSPAGFAVHFFDGPDVEIAERLLSILARHLPVEPGQLHPDDRLVEDLRMEALDSLATNEFVCEIEKEWGVRIPDEVAEKMLTFREVVAFVSARQQVTTQQP